MVWYVTLPSVAKKLDWGEKWLEPPIVKQEKVNWSLWTKKVL